MSTTPDPTRNIGDSCCSKCGELLLVNDSAIVYTDMRNDVPLVLGNCCADLVLGSLIQDYAQKIGNEIAMGYWIKSSADRRQRVADAARKVAQRYEVDIDYGVNRIKRGLKK